VPRSGEQHFQRRAEFRDFDYIKDSFIADLGNATLLSKLSSFRHTLNVVGHDITSLYMSGGHADNLLMMQLRSHIPRL